MLQKVNNENLLNIRNLDMVTHYKDVMALAIKGTSAMTKTESAFISVVLRDVNGDTIVGRMFDVGDNSYALAMMEKMKYKLVKISFYIQEFKGNLYLNLNEITPVNDDSYLNKFNHAVNDIDKYVKIVQEVLPDYPSTYNKALPQVCNGLYGGFTTIVYAWLTNLTPLYSSVEEISKELLMCCINCLFNYYSEQAVSLAPTNVVLMKVLNECTYVDDKVKLYANDFMFGVVTGNTETLISKLLLCNYNNAINTIELCNQYKSTPVGLKNSYRGFNYVKL